MWDRACLKKGKAAAMRNLWTERSSTEVQQPPYVPGRHMGHVGQSAPQQRCRLYVPVSVWDSAFLNRGSVAAVYSVFDGTEHPDPLLSR